MTYEGLRLHFQKVIRKAFSKVRKKSLISEKFTIISNNCWGGMIYESYDLPKETPTVGLFFVASDYIKFVSNLQEYFETELEFITENESKWKNILDSDKRFGTYPIGKLKDIEIFFLHYHSEEEAKQKWKRRIKRVQWDRILIKFNDQNYCTEQDVEEFISLQMKNKVFFTSKHWKKENEWKIKLKNQYVYIKQFPKHDFVMASYEPFGRSKRLDVTTLINSL